MTTSQNEPAQEETGVAQARARQGVTEIGKRGGRRSPNLSRWFWGTIIALLSIVLALNLLAAWRLHQHGTKRVRQDDAGGQLEMKTTLVERAFTRAGEKANEVKGEIGPLLDEAYAPVYAGIPAYLDFHYSLKGEWLELGEAALGEIGRGLDKYLFPELEKRLEAVAEKLGRDFDAKYFTTLDEAVAKMPGGSAALEPVVTKAIDDAKSRMTKTAGLLVGGALTGISAKALSKVFAKKLAMKLAAKVAAKAGTKWGAAASGAGTGAAICSWTGPWAAGCAAGGAVITFLGVDLAMVKLDEYVTRDDFARELRDLIDQQKEATRQVLVKMLDHQEKAADSARKVAVQNVSLSELKDVDRLAACQAAQDILALYDPIRGNLQARSPANVENLRRALKKQAENHLLAPWVEGVETAIANEGIRPRVGGDVTLAVNLPPELRENHAVEARLKIGHANLDFDWTDGNSAGHFELKARPEEKIFLDGSQLIELKLIQDRGLFHWNRIFNGSARLDASETLAEGSGLSPKPKITLPMRPEKAEGPVPRVTLQLPLVGALLSKKEMPEFCTN